MSETANTLPAEFELDRDAQGRMILKRPGQDDAVDVRIRRAFPWSNPQHYISIRSSEGKELLMIEDLSAVEPVKRQFIGGALAEVSFIPRIERIESVDLKFGHQQWSVITDRGPASFRVQEREDIRFLNDGRFRIKDADGNVFELPQFDTLDPHSQRQLEPLM
ncbi:MAG TPA: DUF1854 domain-containing protein [Tepidisphaeraceae bacterium]|jgi:hypothetical protein|nr:DUF1854 domain-containing protein [Tepidisphaeraceae bacterium]